MKKNNDLYSVVLRIKQIFIIVGVLIALASTVFTARLAKSLALEEQKKIEVWVEATRLLTTADNNDSNINDLVLKIIEGNTTIPVIIADKHNNVLDSRNVFVPKSEKEKERYFAASIENSIKKNNKITFPILDDYMCVYYDESNLLKQLYYFPYIQFSGIFIFTLLAFYAFRSTKRTEADRIWIGLTKETAHQLGTPISSLLAWEELLKLKYPEEKLTSEIEKDIHRLHLIAERFSKIGSVPDLSPVDLNEVLENSLEYIKKRASKKVLIKTNFSRKHPVFVNLNIPLFDWVVENLCRNAIDAMGGEGSIFITTQETDTKIIIDFEDTGKGIEKKRFKSIFTPGYTTKKRGWGLGLSLTKRIVEIYHNGRIFVKKSEKEKGTTFRIILNKARS